MVDRQISRWLGFNYLRFTESENLFKKYIKLSNPRGIKGWNKNHVHSKVNKIKL